VVVPESETLSLIALLLIGLVALLLVLGWLSERRGRGSLDPVERRRQHSVAARKSTTLALGCVGLLVVALLLGRLLLGAMALAGLVVFVTLAVVRGRQAR